MNIIARAKPVRISIISNGIECYTFDDLKSNFHFSDVSKAAKDGSLAKWLKQIGRTEAGNFIETLCEMTFNTPIEKNELYKIFFNESFYDQNGYNPRILYGLIKTGCMSINEIPTNDLIELTYKDIDIAIAAYNGKALTAGNADIVDIFTRHKDSESGLPMYIIGREYQNQNNILDWYKGYDFIKRAADKRYKNAQDDIAKHNNYLRYRLDEIDWDDYFRMRSGSNETEKKLYQLFKWCKETMNNLPQKNGSEYLERELNFINVSDTFRFEKIILIKIISLLYPERCSRTSLIDSFLEAISEDHSYAKELLTMPEARSHYENSETSLAKDAAIQYYWNDVFFSGHVTYIQFSRQ